MLKFFSQAALRRRFILWMVLLTTATVLPGPVGAPVGQANCPGFGRPPAEVDRAVRQRWQGLKDDATYFWGPTKMFATIDDRRITLTTGFDRLTGPEKQQVLGILDLAGSTYEVYTADGRLLSAQYDGCTRTNLLTERDRFAWYLTRPPIAKQPLPLLAERLRNAGHPQWRKVQYSIDVADERQIRLKFWQTVGYKRYNQGWWIAWVPEGGYFEVTLGNADAWSQLQPKLPTIMGQYRYVVLAKDGTPLFEKPVAANPWQLALGKTGAPTGWQVRPCNGTAPFLCIERDRRPIGSVELQRWPLEKRPNFQAALSQLDAIPGLITYNNPSDRAKVVTALKDEVASYYRTIAREQRQAYGPSLKFESAPLQELNTGALPGIRYGFTLTDAAGNVREQSMSYMTFDGATDVYVVTTCFEHGNETCSFQNRADLIAFDPIFQTIVTHLQLPNAFGP